MERKNKNVTLARCRLIWAVMAKTGMLKYEAIYSICGASNILSSLLCPLCDYCKNKFYNTNCEECIDWGGRWCKDSKSPYQEYNHHKSPEEIKIVAKNVLATIDRAITLYDKTGNWK